MRNFFLFHDKKSSLTNGQTPYGKEKKKTKRKGKGKVKMRE